MYPSSGSHTRRMVPLGAMLILALSLLAFILLTLSSAPVQAQAATDLTVEINAGYNLVVDSNVSSPSTAAPSAATVMGRFCNSGGGTLNDVQAYIGDFTAGTPGLYPVRGAGATTFTTNDGGDYAFQHIGGRAGLADATRFIGSLGPGECSNQYWHFSYPQCVNLGDGTSVPPPCGAQEPVWGLTNDPNDDLWLEFDMWGTSDAGTGNNATWTMTHRNEISAMANKIQPNPNGEWFNTNTALVQPGGVITSNGILYELGNINKGFDNDGDFAYDYNAWLQPIGEPDYDPSCFRLIGSTGVLTVSRSSGNPDMIIPFDDQLYFTDLPADNTGVVGLVKYAFLALDGPCSTMLTPYQEVASGADNEKYNADYGTSIPPIGSTEPEVTINKESSPSSIPLGTSVTYNIPLYNTSTTDSSPTLPLGSGALPLVISDTIPAGGEFVSASADVGVTVRYSTDNGVTWSTTPPGDLTTVTTVQWWLNDQLPPDTTATGTLQVFFPVTYVGPSFIENDACAGFGNGVSFACDDTITAVQGDSSIGDYVWADLNTDGVQTGESGIPNISVFLYWDRNGDGLLDDGDLLLETQVTDGAGAYDFIDLPNGDYIVAVDGEDADMPVGYNYTTPKIDAVTIAAASTDYNNADFGFGPILNLTKSLTNGEFDGVNNDNIYEGQLATYNINVINTRPGGTGPGNACQYMVWAGTATGTGPTNSQWQNMTAVPNAPDGSFSYTVMANNDDVIDLGGYFASPQAGNITNVQYVLYIKELIDLDVDDSMDVVISNAGTIYDSTVGGDFDGAFFAGQTAGQFFQATIDLGTSLGWVDFASTAANPINVNVIGNRGGGTSGEIAMDAAGFIITTDETCGDATDTLNPVPVTDTYDPTQLEFVSANPPVSSDTPAGTLTWNNVGPLAAGETQSIEVTFRALQPTINPEVATNTADSTGATYIDGRPANDVSDSVDADLFLAHTIGDYVWFDADGAGDQDPTEPGLAGVVVELYLTGNTTIFYNGQTYEQNDLIATAVTDGNGGYLFTGIPGAGANTDDYEVRINETASPVLTGLTLTGGTDPFVVNNLNGDITTADFGYNGGSIVFGTVWHDADADAVDPNTDTNETYISGVTVELDNGTCTLGVDCPSTTTDQDGNYTFTNVPDGNYTIVVTPPGTQVAEPTGENTAGVCGTCNNQHTITVTAATDPVNGGYNFGYTGADIGDTLYVDWDGSGTQDAGEEGIPNVDVRLYSDLDGDGVVDAEDSLLDTQTTDGTGQYLFTNYPAGNYIVIVDTGDTDFPNSYIQTADPDATLDSRHALTTDGSNDTLTVDFGYQPQGTGAIGDLVWSDTDGDGVLDAGETGIPAITVTLYEDTDGNGVYDAGTDAVISTTITAADGTYLFPNLPAGDYLVDVDTADADLPTDGNSNPYILTTNNDPQAVTITAGQTFLDADFGFTTPGLIGDTVYEDTNGNGQQDLGEPGISGVVLELQDGTCTPGVDCPTVTTDGSGLYEFDGLPAGDFTVVVISGVPAGFTQTGDPDSSVPCGGAGACDGQSTVTLLPGQVDRSRDFGYQPNIVLGDYVWLDLNGDGVQDASEPGLPNVEVTLSLQGGGTVVTLTDADGYYMFGGIADGTHTATVTGGLPAGVVATYDLDDGTAGPTGSTAVTVAGASRLDVDFGYRYNGPHSISGIVFYDSGNDGGEPMIGEPTYPGVTVYLWDDSGNFIAQTTTNQAGGYTFTNLPTGTYNVSVGSNDGALNGDAYTTPGINTGTIYEQVVNLNSDVTGVDFGFFGTPPAPTAVTLSTVAAAAVETGWIILLVGLMTVVTIITIRRRRTGWANGR